MAPSPSRPTSEGPGARPGGEPGTDELRGVIERVTYADPNTLYTVLRIAPDKGYRVPGDHVFVPTRVTAVGRVEAPSEGLRVRLTGRFGNHPSHGQQFEFDALEVLPPDTPQGLVRYLSSGAFQGIGPTLAGRIVEALGTDALRLIMKEPERLDGIRGLRPGVAERLVEQVRVELSVHEAHAFLRGLGLGPVMAAAVLKKLGPDCEERIRRDPYVLARGIAGIGFAIADRAARHLGIEEDDVRRVSAAMVHALEKAAGDGHTMLPREVLLERTAEILREPPVAERAEEALERLLQEDRVLAEAPPVVDPDAPDSADDVNLFLPPLATSERQLARHLDELVRCAPVTPLASADDLAEAEARAGMELHPSQRAAVLGLLAAPVGLLTGGPGVGKTTIVRLLVQLAAKRGADVLLASPTGRAAKRLAEASDHPASTIHRMLGFEPFGGGYQHDAQNPLKADLIVVDEISMLDVILAHHLLKAIQAPTRVVFVGDPDQLPSVGAGNVLRDLLDSGRIPVHRLTHIYRQAQSSLIVTNAHRILSGENPELPERGDTSADFYFFPADTGELAAQRLVDVVTERIPRTFGLDWADDVQVISPMYRGACGVDSLNERLRDALGIGGLEVVRGGRTWRTGDRVVHTRNDYEKEVFNGDMGRIVKVDPNGSLIVRFPERDVPYTGGELSDLQPAFCITVHRSQGGEYPGVVLPMVMEHRLMLQRHLLYTAVTRARKLVVIVGEQRALSAAIRNAEQNHRFSSLAERLRELGDEGGRAG